MSTYKAIVGKKVKSVSSDPSDSIDGQMWYNTTTQSLRGLAIFEATHSGTTMPNKKSLYGGGVGTSTAGLTVGGIDDSSYLNSCEEWNGLGWAAGGNYPTNRYSAGTAGTQTAAMAYCGRVPGSPGGPTETYEYDGSSWTSGNSFPTPGNSMQGIGAVDTAVVSTEVYTSTNMHHWNGTSWTSANARNTAKGGQAAFGTQTAAVLAGGFPSDSDITELYDGTNWTSGNTMNTGRQQVAGSGTQTDGMAFGGDRPPSEAAQTTIESWDGTSWSTSPATLATARARAGAGRNTAAGTWIAGGIGPGGGGEGFDATEVYEKSTNVVTAAAWASSGNLNTARDGHATTTNAAADTGLVFGGNYPSGTDNSESYDGTSWTEGPNLPQALSFLGGAGTATAGLSFTGRLNPGPRVASTYEWDGSSWTAGGDYGASQAYSGGAGTQTAAIGVAGELPPGTDLTTSYEYNGSSWTAGNACNVPGYDALVFGTSAGAHMACLTGPPSSLETEAYDGTNWTASATAVVAQNQGGASGTYPIGLIFGGASTVPSTSTQGWDGTAWSTRPSMGTGRRADGSGTTAQGLATGGETPSSPTSNATEEFTPESSSVNIKTFSSS